MAEFVQSRTQELTPIMEQILQLKLLSSVKVKEIIAQIESHEYNIQKTTRNLDDILRYVDYQLSVLNIIRKSRKELQIFTKTEEIDEKLQHRINSLFGLHQRNFYNDMEFWIARINFTLGQKWHDQTSRTYKDLTNFLGKDYPFLWQRASDFEWKRNHLKGIDSARRLLQLGIRGDNHNLDLYVWTFELELKHAEFLSLEKAKLESKKKHFNIDYDCEIKKCFYAAKVVFDQAKNNFWGKDCTVKLYVLFHSAMTKYPQTFDSEFQLLRQLEANCSSEEETYHVLAMIAFNNGDLETGIEKLAKGLEVVQTVKMYELAVNDLVELVVNDPSQVVFRQLHTILNHGHNKDKLSAICYVKWAELGLIWEGFLKENATPGGKKRKLNGASSSSLEKDSKEDLFPMVEINDTLKLGLSKYPNHPDLLVAKVQAMVRNQDMDQEEIFGLISIMGNTHGTSDTLYTDLCNQLFIGFVLNPCRRKSLEKLVDRVMDKKLKEKLTIMLLNNVALNDKIEKARMFYNKRSHMSSYKLDHRMAELEFLNLDHEFQSAEPYKYFRDIMERACVQYGKLVDPWLDYIRFEKQLNHSSDRSHKLYLRALKALPENVHESFISREQNLLKK